jgi:hypothetical protein
MDGRQIETERELFILNTALVQQRTSTMAIAAATIH